MTFKKGNIVRLKSDDKKMTITRIVGENSDIFMILRTAGYVETDEHIRVKQEKEHSAWNHLQMQKSK